MIQKNVLNYGNEYFRFCRNVGVRTLENQLHVCVMFCTSNWSRAATSELVGDAEANYRAHQASRCSWWNEPLSWKYKVYLEDFYSFQPEREKQDEAAGAVCVCVCALRVCLRSVQLAMCVCVCVYLYIYTCMHACIHCVYVCLCAYAWWDHVFSLTSSWTRECAVAAALPLPGLSGLWVQNEKL